MPMERSNTIRRTLSSDIYILEVRWVTIQLHMALSNDQQLTCKTAYQCNKQFHIDQQDLIIKEEPNNEVKKVHVLKS